MLPHKGEPMRIDWINPQSHRYYSAELVTNLFGEPELVRAWGGIGSARGGQSSEPDPAPDALVRVAKRRKQRGYVPSGS